MLKIVVSPMGQEESAFAGLPPWMGRLLRARGVATQAEARAFLHPAPEQIRPPLALPGMERAAEILRAAGRDKRRVAIYGDYDVDGVCASAILHSALTALGVPCLNYIPDRHEEGYGLNLPAVEALAKECQVLLTVDCGITSVQEVAAARRAGMAVIVTDHHRLGEALPEADAVVSPLLDDYPFPFLCGAGVAWKLALALLGDGALPLMELAALATVADMVPLTGENRAIVALGLKRLSRTERPGLRALMRTAGVGDEITSEQVAFQLAPRMNACGRIESARTALELLLTKDAARAEELALRLENLNQERKRQEARVIEEAQAQVESMDLVALRGIVVCGEDWNSGVVGLAAGRIAEKYCYPTVALARTGDVCVGSARSAGEVDIFQALQECRDLFLRFGGHKQAAGLTIEARNLLEFSRRFSQAVARQTGDQPPLPQLTCDGELTLSQVTEETVALLAQLEPCGMGNPAPRFLCEGVRALSLRAVGAQGKHLKCTLRQGDALRDGIFFGGGAWATRPAGAFRLVMTPTLNEFRGRVSAECRLYALELLPDTLPMERGRELLSLLAERRGGSPAETLSDGQMDELLTGAQGTLLVCRCRETALMLHGRFPKADFCLGAADDPRAYHTILLYGGVSGTCASYRHVVLCDGDLGEKDACRAACPGARVWALPMSVALKGLLRDAFVDKDALRACYKRLRQAPLGALSELSGACGLTEGQGAFALAVFAELELAEVCLTPFSVSLLPMTRRDPEDSPLFRAAKRAKEEEHGIYGL